MLLWKDCGAGREQTVWTRSLSATYWLLGLGKLLNFPKLQIFNCLSTIFCNERMWKWCMDCNAVLLGRIGISEDRQGGGRGCGALG